MDLFSGIVQRLNLLFSSSSSRKYKEEKTANDVVDEEPFFEEFVLKSKIWTWHIITDQEKLLVKVRSNYF